MHGQSRLDPAEMLRLVLLPVLGPLTFSSKRITTPLGAMQPMVPPPAAP
jgi:hypothetical protein